MRDSVKLEGLFDTSVNKLGDYLEGKEDDSPRAKVASQTLSNYIRFRAVEAHEKGLGFAVARAITENQDQLRDMIRKSLPEYGTI